MTQGNDQSPSPATVAASPLVKDKSIVKIAVQRKSYLPQLIEFDQSQPLTVIIKQLCSFWMIEDPDNYALQFSDHQFCKYVTEKNRNDIKNGSILQLDYSVEKTVTEILRDLVEIDVSLSGSQNFEMLEKLLMLSSDPVFAAEFNANKGLNLMIEKIERSKLNDKQLALTITAFLELMEHGFVSWDSLSTNFLPILNSLLFTSTKDKDNSFKIIKATLQTLENIVLNSGSENLQKSNNEVLAKSLQSLLDTMDFDDQKQIVIQQNILALLNALILKADETQRQHIVANFDLKPIQYILMNKGDTLGTEMAHQLYVLQQLILNFLFEDRMFGKIDSQDTEALEKIRDLKRIAFESDICTFYSSDVNVGGSGSVGGSSCSSGISATGNNSGTNRNKNTIGKDYRKLGFKNELNPLLDFNETPPGVLALDCMHYFATTYPDQYCRIVLENSCRHDQYECPFVLTSIALVKVLCELFRIGEPANDQADHYYPIFFSHSRAFEQIFTIAINLLNKTWREMKATTEDFVKVFAVVREQLSRALQTKPRDLDAFRSILKTLSYNEIIKLWQQERNSREEWESHAKPIVELKELIIPEILELIKQRRLNYLCEGTRFVKYTNRGQRIKDKFWFIKLSSNRKVFHYGDCDESNNTPTIEDLPNKVTVADIRALVTGKECPHMKDSKGRKVTYQLAFSLILDATTFETDSNSQSLNFVAQTEQVYTYWTDGICALLNQPMTSKETELDLETLLSMEIKLRLLDVEGIDIPQEPPIVPPEPLNFDFYFTQN